MLGRLHKDITERGGSVVTHETRIRVVPGSNPGTDQPDWGFFVVFLSHQGNYAGPGGLGVEAWPDYSLGPKDCGFESRLGHGCL